MAKDFERIPLICGLLVYGNIVDPVLKRKIYLRIIVSHIYLFWEFRGAYYLGFESKSPGSICRALKEQIWPRHFKIWLIKAQGG